MPYTRGVKVNLFRGHISVMVALKGPVVNIRLYTYIYVTFPENVTGMRGLTILNLNPEENSCMTRK